jgi:hypothetical protein
VSGASIDRIYISRWAGLGRDPYDSDADDLTEIYDRGSDLPPFVVPANGTASLEVYYNLDHEWPLLIAVDFTASRPSGIRYIDDQMPPGKVAAYWVLGAHARDADRTVAADQQRPGRLYLIEGIDWIE